MEKQRSSKPLENLAIGGAAAICAVCFTNPLEVIKIRMQLQGELKARGQHAVHYKNVFNATYVIAKHDGVLSLQAGLVPAMWFQLFLNGCRFGFYQIMSDKGIMKDKQGNLVFWKSILVGGFVGALGACVGSPFFLIKTHLQSKASSEIAFGHQHQHRGMWSGLWNVYKEHGVKGLFRGTSAAVPRAFFGSTSQLTSFSYCKEWMEKENVLPNSPLLKTFTASMIGGVVVAVVMAPFDLISTRLYNQGVDAKGKGMLYNGYLDCVYKVWRSEGILSFYKGIGPCYFRLGPHTVLCLVFWDQFKNLHQKYLET